MIATLLMNAVPRLLTWSMGLVFPVATVLPVPGPVVSTYKQPECQWCAGRRGVVFDSRPGEAVRTVVGGHIFFAGVVAGVRYVTVRTGDGWKVTFGRLAASPLERGDFVLPGAVIGTAGDNLFMSLRRGQTPYNPALMYPRRAILLP